MGNRSSMGDKQWKRLTQQRFDRRNKRLADGIFKVALFGALVWAIAWLGAHDKGVLHPGPVYVGTGSTSAAYAR